MGIHVTAFAPSVVNIWFGAPGDSILIGETELLAISSVCTAPVIIFAELTESSASSAVPTAPAVISRLTSLKAALVPPVMVRSEEVMSPVPPTPPTCARTKALVAAS